MTETLSLGPGLPLSPMQLVLVVLGGGLGGMARHALSSWAVAVLGESFPWGTLIVNVSGAAGIGMAAAWLLPAAAGSQAHVLWSGLVIGVLGSYTTVSSFSLQTWLLFSSGRAWAALLNILLSVSLCLGAALLGFTGLHMLMDSGF